MKKSADKWCDFNFDTCTIREPVKITSKDNKRSTSYVAKPKLSRSLILIDELRPIVSEDLAVHSKKVIEVQSWLQLHVGKRLVPAPVLLITGPTGSCKTTTVNVLCDTMGLQLVEWVNPVDQVSGFSYAPAQSTRFIEFFMQSKYSSLCDKSFVSKRIVLVEDIPNFIIHNPSDFAEILEKCVTQGTPMIFICTDVSSGTLDLSQHLFTQEIKEKFKITTINFNPCSNTLLKNVLKRAQSAVEKHKDFLVPEGNVIDDIIASANGDIRCAINQYNFACLREVDPSKGIENIIRAKRPSKRKRSSNSMEPMNKDEKLSFFHGLGRVLNPKLSKIGDAWRIDCDFKSLVDQFAIQPANFTSFLQHNYLNYFGELSDVQKASDNLSQAQMFLDKWDDRHEKIMYSLWISVLGLMVFNEHRVSKWNQIKAPTKIKFKNSTLRNCANSIDGLYYNIIRKDNMFHTLKKL